MEQISIDEAFLDVSEQVPDWSEAVELASRLQARCATKSACPLRWG